MSSPKKEYIEKLLQNVYDPEFPLIDIYSMGLIYNIDINEEKKIIYILMTFTSPLCPMGDLIEEMIKEEIKGNIQEYEVDIEITFEPLRSPELIKDEDIKQMFE